MLSHYDINKLSCQWQRQGLLVDFTAGNGSAGFYADAILLADSVPAPHWTDSNHYWIILTQTWGSRDENTGLSLVRSYGWYVIGWGRKKKTLQLKGGRRLLIPSKKCWGRTEVARSDIGKSFSSVSFSRMRPRPPTPSSHPSGRDESHTRKSYWSQSGSPWWSY